MEIVSPNYKELAREFESKTSSHAKFARRARSSRGRPFIFIRIAGHSIKSYILREPRDEAKRVLRGHHMHSVYVLENQNDKSWYIGQTDNLKRRFGQHNNGQGGRTTKIKDGKWKLIYVEVYCDKRDALGREKFLKGGSGRKYLKKQLSYYLGLR